MRCPGEETYWNIVTTDEDESQKQVIGAWTTETNTAMNPVVALQHIHILPEHRKKGIATTIVTEFVNEHEKCIVCCRSSLVPLMLKCGFTHSYDYAETCSKQMQQLMTLARAMGTPEKQIAAGQSMLTGGNMKICTTWDEPHIEKYSTYI
jgi:GNAT superfamily N-acetyltransferase